jgi:hypothetical protein
MFVSKLPQLKLGLCYGTVGSLSDKITFLKIKKITVVFLLEHFRKALVLL